MRALFLSLAILLVHVSPLRAARNPAGQPLTAMARALRTGDNILAGTWDTMDERDEAQDAAWDDELVRIVGLHPAGLLALELRTSSLNTTAVEEPVAEWIDPDLLEQVSHDCVCGVCFGVMVEPASGCPEGHSFCKACWVKVLHEQKKCPTCRLPVAGKLVRNRQLEGMIAQLRMRCEQEECGWRGCVGGRAAHLPVCEWVPVKCPNRGCAESPLRKDLFLHQIFCEHRKVSCVNCQRKVAYQSLAEHEGVCLEAEIECPNKGCSVQYQRMSMNVHRVKCEHEEVTCPGCDARCLRKGLEAHVQATHLSSTVQLVLKAWCQHAVYEEQLQRLLHENARLTANQGGVESEQRHAEESPTSWVFNWRANGWGPGNCTSESHDWGEVSGHCVFQSNVLPIDFSLHGQLRKSISAPKNDRDHWHYIGFVMEGIDVCSMHVMFSILDKHDKTLFAIDFIDPDCSGAFVSLTEEEKEQSVRSDGSIRLRAVVRLFLDGAA